MLLVPLFALLLHGCTGQGEEAGPDGALVAARLENVELTSMALLVGGVHMDATLTVEDVQGGRFSAPVVVDGVVAGLAVTMLGANAEVVPFFLPDDGITAEDLLGGYTGAGTALVAGVGIVTQHLTNEAGVELNSAFFGLGVSVEVAFEAVTLWQFEAFQGVVSGDSGGDAS